MTNIAKCSDKEKWVYSGYGITFDEAVSWNFCKDFAKNIDNSRSSNTDNCKNNFLVLGEGLIYDVYGSFGSPEKKFSGNFIKAGYNFAWVCITVMIIVISLFTEKKSSSLKPIIKNVYFRAQFCLESVSNRFGATDSWEVSLKGHVYDFFSRLKCYW